jgi:hypothetical protein
VEGGNVKTATPVVPDLASEAGASSTADQVSVLSFEAQGTCWVETSRSLGGNKRGDRNYEFQN